MLEENVGSEGDVSETESVPCQSTKPLNQENQEYDSRFFNLILTIRAGAIANGYVPTYNPK